MTTSTPNPGWPRGQITVRLTAKRRANLEKIANGMGPSATPMDALDHAIHAACAPPAPDNVNARLNDLEDMMEALSVQVLAETGRLETIMKTMAKGLNDLHALISEVAAQQADDC